MNINSPLYHAVKTSVTAVFLFCLIIGDVTSESSGYPVLSRKKIFHCGSQPKQVIFSPDNSAIVVPLLDDNGFDVIPAGEGTAVQRIMPPRAAKKGFAEGLFIPEEKAFLISQMTTGYIYEYEYPGFTFRREIKAGGVWCKFIAWSPGTRQIAVSNWLSDTVSIIDYESGGVVQRIHTKSAPRGILFTENGNVLIVLCFDGGSIQKFNTTTGRETASIDIRKSAMRHIAINSSGSKAYVSDMYHAAVYAVDLDSFKITSTWHVFNNPNTIALDEDRWLYVSSRGPNNPDEYTKRSPVNGRITLIDVTDGKTVQTVEGGNQPTGLAVSTNGKLLCFSNFQDADIELYLIQHVSPEDGEKRGAEPAVRGSGER
jgi:YVTN family beta-propeller protein